MNYAAIKFTDIANGPGVRVSLFVSGCTRHCPGCFNEEAQDFSYGTPFTDVELNKIIEKMEPDHIRGLSILGGEPFEPANQDEVFVMVNVAKKVYPEKSIWVYTGFTFEELLERNEEKWTGWILERIDYLVDGPFIESLKNPNLRFRGSSNQRIIDVQKSIREKKVILWEG